MSEPINHFGGYRVFSSPNLTKSVTVKIEKSRFERLIDIIHRWNPCNEYNPDFIVKQIPSDEVIINGNDLYAHPSVIAAMNVA